MLNHAAELVAYNSQDELIRFLQSSYNSKMPESGRMFHVTWTTDKNVDADFAVSTPHHMNLPSIPENVSSKLKHLFVKRAPNMIFCREI